MIRGLAGVTVFSADHMALVPSYRDVLGLEVQEEGDGEVLFFTGGPRSSSRRTAK